MQESFRVERAVSRLNPVTPNGWIIEWQPPEIMASASPRRIMLVASPMAWVLAAQAVSVLKFGPSTPKSWAMWAAAMFGSCSASTIFSRHL